MYLITALLVSPGALKISRHSAQGAGFIESM